MKQEKDLKMLFCLEFKFRNSEKFLDLVYSIFKYDMKHHLAEQDMCKLEASSAC